MATVIVNNSSLASNNNEGEQTDNRSSSSSSNSSDNNNCSSNTGEPATSETATATATIITATSTRTMNCSSKLNYILCKKVAICIVGMLINVTFDFDFVSILPTLIFCLRLKKFCM